MLSIIWNLVLFVIVLGVIVFIHELGHFIWAKICGVYVYEFALGMGPKLWGFKKGDTEYNLRLVPIGGFCSLAGEDFEFDNQEKVPKEKRLNEKSKLQRFLILFFGPANNFLLSLVLLFFISMVWGGVTMNPVITGVQENTPAYEVGMSAGDKILSINDHKVSTSDDILLFLTVSNKKKNNTIKVEKEDGTLETYKVKPAKKEENGKTSYYFGIEIKNEKTTGFINGLKYTGAKFCSEIKQMGYTLGFLVTGKVSLKELSGPVGIYSIVGQQSKAGLQSILLLIVYLSINVGFLNLVPLPAFDGGHILFIIIEALRGKPVDPELENKIHAVGLMVLMGLMLIITVSDVIKLF